MDLARRPARDLLRSVGGLLFASGVVAWEIRKAGSWGLGGRMVVVMVPAVVSTCWRSTWAVAANMALGTTPSHGRRSSRWLPCS